VEHNPLLPPGESDGAVLDDAKNVWCKLTGQLEVEWSDVDAATKQQFVDAVLHLRSLIRRTATK